jgi:hypothetical protein
LKHYHLCSLTGIIVLGIALLAIFYPTYGETHPKMTQQQLDWIRTHPEYPLRLVGISLVFVAVGIILISFVWFKLEKRFEQIERRRLPQRALLTADPLNQDTRRSVYSPFYTCFCSLKPSVKSFGRQKHLYREIFG